MIRERSAADLEENPVSLPATAAHRDRLLKAFYKWLADKGLSLDDFSSSGMLVAHALRAYGKYLYLTHMPHGEYAETVNAVVDRLGHL